MDKQFHIFSILLIRSFKFTMHEKYYLLAIFCQENQSVVFESDIWNFAFLQITNLNVLK